MPITFTAIGNLLDAVIVDDNFSSVDDLLRSGLSNTDLSGTIDRYRIRRYTGGRIVTALAGSRPFARDTVRDGSGTRSERGMLDSIFDLSFDGASEECLATESKAPADMVEGADQRHYKMELLGQPGPSFYFDWQEDGYAEPTGAADWPPSGWPYAKWPSNLCFSRWLTVPRAAVRVFVDQPCVVKIRASCLVSANMFRALVLWKYHHDNSLADPFTNSPTSLRLNTRWINFARFGLFVDTNPQLFADEFVNLNPNIVSATVSWVKAADRTFEMGQRQMVTLEAEVALVGNRFYNFSFRYKDAATHGWAEQPHDEGTVFHSGNFESSTLDYSLRTPEWQAYLPPEASAAGMAWYPNWINLWETTSLSVEMKYKEATAYAESA